MSADLISEIARLQLGTGDVLVVRTSERLTRDQALLLREQVRSALPEPFPVLVLGPDTEISVVSLDPSTKRPAGATTAPGPASPAEGADA